MNEEEQVVVEESKGTAIKDLLFIARKHWIAIVSFVVVACGLGYGFSKIETPVYESTGTMLVSYEGTNQGAVQDFTFSDYISKTYVVFLKENIVLDRVSEITNIQTKTLKEKLNVSNSSLIIKVSYTADDPDEAKYIVDTVIDIAQEIADRTTQVLGEDGVTYVEKPVYHLLYDNLKVLSPATIGKRVSHTLRDVAIGCGIGAVGAIIYVFLRELFDSTFKSSEEIERLLNIPVLAGIPYYEFEHDQKEKEGVKE